MPPHDGLQDDREFDECYILRNDQAAPDERLDFLQLDPELVLQRRELLTRRATARGVREGRLAMAAIR